MTGLGSSCGACKYLRRRCASDCIFTPYFSHEQASTHFSAVHKVFGASNVSKLLLHLPVERRGDAAITISYEALARMRDPVYGCVAHIFALQQQVCFNFFLQKGTSNSIMLFIFNLPKNSFFPLGEVLFCFILLGPDTRTRSYPSF